MKDIGIKLKNKREENGLEIDEVADDLNIKVEELTAIEEGDKDKLSDISRLKEVIATYSKYLGFDENIMLDELNEYLFDQTSRISLIDIKEAQKIKNNMEKEKISSPYTQISSNKKKTIILVFLLILLLIIVGILSFMIFKNLNKEIPESNISYIVGGQNEYSE